MDERATDLKAIRDLIDRQFASMSWSVGGGPDEALFKSDFVSGSPLYPAGRPVSAKSADAFMERMGELARTTLPSFHERVIGTQILVFGNVAVAAAAGEQTDNEGKVDRVVEMLLLVKSGGRWTVGAQAWDKETSSTPIPNELLAHR